MKNDIIVSQACMATQLRKYIQDSIDGDPLWCARYNATKPDLIAQVLFDFLDAGAMFIHTNTYQSSIQGHMEHLGLSKEESIELITKAVKLAHEAREKFFTKHGRTTDGFPWILGCAGAYGAYLHDASEYSGDYASKVTVDFLKDWHKPRTDVILKAGVDGLSFMTIPCQVEAKAIADLLCDEYPTVKFLISFQCKDGKNLASGESFAETCDMLWNQFKLRGITDNCIAIGVNCVKPDIATELFETVNGNKPTNQQIPLAVAANSEEVYDKEKQCWVRPENVPNMEEIVPKWIRLGARAIGGGCRTKIEIIQRFKDIIAKLD